MAILRVAGALMTLLVAVLAFGEGSPSTLRGSKPEAKKTKKPNIRTRSVVLGVRGLDEGHLKAAMPDLKALARLDQLVPSESEVEAFANRGSGRLTVVDAAGTNESSSAELSDEIKQGREIAATLLGAAPLVENVELQRYVNLVGAWIARRSERPGLPWRFGVLDSDAVNAFAAPGGYVLITAGLYRRLRSEAELAGVIAHEISHIVGQDHYRMLVLSRSMRSAGETSQKMMSKVPGFKKIAGMTIDRGVEIFTKALDRSTELAADRMGCVLAADAGYRSGGLSDAISALQAIPRDDDKVALLFKTHPDPRERVKALEEILREGRLATQAGAPNLAERFEQFSL